MSPKEMKLTIAAIREHLTPGDPQAFRPAVPMPGGHGTRHHLLRAQWCHRYLHAYTPVQRAQVTARMLALRVDENNVLRQGNDFWSSQMQAQAQQWWLLHRERLKCPASARAGAWETEQDQAARSPGDGWRLVLLAIGDIARRDAGPEGSEMHNAVELLAERKADAERAPVARSDEPTRQKADALEWSHVVRSMKDDRLAPTWLAAYLCFRLHAALCVRMPRDSRVRPLYAFIDTRLSDICNGRESGADYAAICSHERDDIATLVSEIVEPLRSLRIFGGKLASLHVPEGFPACFEPFGFQVVDAPDIAQAALVTALQAAGRPAESISRAVDSLTTADLLAALIEDSLFDAMRLDQILYPVKLDQDKTSGLSKTLGVMIAYQDNVPSAFLRRWQSNKKFFEPRLVADRTDKVRSAKRQSGAPYTESAHGEPIRPAGFHWACRGDHEGANGKSKP